MGRNITSKNPYTPKSGSLAGQTFTSNRQYQNALLQLKGGTTISAQRRAGRALGSTAIAGLSKSERNEYRDTLDVIRRMRRNGETLLQASAAERIDPAIVRKYAGRYLFEKDGQSYATTKDRLIRPMTVLTPFGSMPIYIKDSRSASLNGAYWNAVIHYLDTGDDSALQKFKGKGITSNGNYHPFITNTDVIDQLASVGGLDISEIYSLSR